MSTSRLVKGWLLLFALVFSSLGLLQGCGPSSPRFTSSGVSSSWDSDLRGIASYYADEFHARKTANGETYDMYAMTAAHRTLPFNTKVKVKNLENDRTVIVRVNDRGPFKEGRVIDLSLEAARQLGLIVKGTAPVQIEIVELGSIQK